MALERMLGAHGTSAQRPSTWRHVLLDVAHLGEVVGEGGSLWRLGLGRELGQALRLLQLLGLLGTLRCLQPLLKLPDQV